MAGQLQLWENGDVYDRNLAKSFASLNGVIVCYDPTQPSSFKSVRVLLRQQLRHHLLRR